jgi:ABC-type transporter Mla MlaB component
MHQGGIVQTQKGEWVGFSMMDANSVGRLTCLSPITWHKGWPYFGLPGNLGRTPRIWVKPDTGCTSGPSAPYNRNDDFGGPELASVWQWNHVPVDGKWSLTERPGWLRLHSLSAPDFWQARNALTQRAIGPVSVPTVRLDVSGLGVGDTAGLALLNSPYAWIGVRYAGNDLELTFFDQSKGKSKARVLTTGQIWLRAHCNFLTEKARFSYSLDGRRFVPFGDEFTTIFQLTTFQGVRYALFAYGSGGGHADFTAFTVDEPRPRALTRPIPVGKRIRLENMDGHRVLVARGDGLACVPTSDPLARSGSALFGVVDRGRGRIALQVADGRFVTVTGLGADGRVSIAAQREGDQQVFQWSEMPLGDLLFLSIESHRHLRALPDGVVQADEPGAQFDRRNGASFDWQEVSIHS